MQNAQAARKELRNLWVQALTEDDKESRAKIERHAQTQAFRQAQRQSQELKIESREVKS
jgi:hypothetical protein